MQADPHSQVYISGADANAYKPEPNGCKTGISALSVLSKIRVCNDDHRSAQGDKELIIR
jgi:hypothetical protein